MRANKSSFIFSSLYASYSCLRTLLFKVVFLPISKQITNSLFHIPNPGIIQNQKSNLHGAWLSLHKVAKLECSYPSTRGKCLPPPLTAHSLTCPCNPRPEQSGLGGWRGAQSIPVLEPWGDFPVCQVSVTAELRSG